jgi:poly(A) polymerase
VEQPRFRAGFDFMRLRADSGEVDETLADWWQEFSLASDAVREDLIDQAREEAAKSPTRQRVRAAPRRDAGEAPARNAGGESATDDDTDTGPDTADGPPAEGEAGAPPKRRRRRRRSNATKNVANNEEPTGT